MQNIGKILLAVVLGLVAIIWVASHSTPPPSRTSQAAANREECKQRAGVTPAPTSGDRSAERQWLARMGQAIQCMTDRGYTVPNP